MNLPSRSRSSVLLTLACSLLLVGAFACGDDDAPTDAGGSDAPDASEGLSPVTLQFSAVVGSAEFACGTSYEGLGTEAVSWEARDLRFYVHDVALINAAGEETPVTLDDDDMWQNGEVALLDFENGCGSMGTPSMNTVVRGQAPAGTYTGVRFKVGVPPSLNHADAATAETPLNLTSMFWNWLGGYKFMRIEGPSTNLDTWRIHLGSTMCTGDMAGNATCDTPNAANILLMGQDPLSASIQLDIEALVAGSNLGNTMDTHPGCMAAPTDMDCKPFFDSLGLPFAGTDSPGQTAFSLQP